MSLLDHVLYFVRLSKIEGNLSGYGLLLLAVYSVEKVVLPYIVTHGILQASAGRIGGRSAGTVAKYVLVIVILLAITRASIVAAYNWGLTMQQRLSVATRHDMFRRLAELQSNADTAAASSPSELNPVEPPRLQEKRLGHILTHLENIPTVMEQVFCKVFNSILPSLATLLSIIVFFFVVDVWLGLSAVILMLVSGALFV